MHDLIDMAQARALADAGMNAALAHAESIDSAWSATAFRFLLKFASENKTFRGDEVVDAAIAWGMSVPVRKAWGGVLYRAKGLKVITRIGYVPNPKRHCATVPLWESKIYKGEPC